MKKWCLIAATAFTFVSACNHGDPYVVDVRKIPVLDAGPYPQPQQDVAPVPSRACIVTEDFRKTCASLAKAGCPEGGNDGAGRACPDHLAAVCAEKAVIPTKCAIEADGDMNIIRTCGAKDTLRWRCIKL